MTDCNSCDKDCNAREKQAGESDEQFRQRQAVAERMCRIKHKYIVLSGKGGVGKSTVAANTAVALAQQGKKVGLLDVDIHGPSIPRLFGLDDARLQGSETAIEPVVYQDLKIMSVGFMLGNRDEAIIWRGPMKYGAIKQLLGEVNWGDLDYLIIDCPPGTGDEPLGVIQIIGDADGGVVVTTPQDVALNDVRKSISFCAKLNLPVVGVVENMSGFACPDCGKVTHIFKEGGAMAMAKDMNVPFLGKVPIEPEIVNACDNGTPYVTAFEDSKASEIFTSIAGRLINAEVRS